MEHAKRRCIIYYLTPVWGCCCLTTPVWGWTIRLKTKEERKHLIQNEINKPSGCFQCVLSDFTFTCPLGVRIVSVQKGRRNGTQVPHKAGSSQNKRRRKAVMSTSLDLAITSDITSFLKVLTRQILGRTLKHLGGLIGVTKQEMRRNS